MVLVSFRKGEIRVIAGVQVRGATLPDGRVVRYQRVLAGPDGSLQKVAVESSGKVYRCLFLMNPASDKFSQLPILRGLLWLE